MYRYMYKKEKESGEKKEEKIKTKEGERCV